MTILNPGNDKIDSTVSKIKEDEQQTRYNRATHSVLPAPSDNTQKRAFERELADPIFCQDPITESLFKIYSFNQERFDPNLPTITLLHAFGSSPTTRQGHEMGWELRQRFPNNLIIAIGSEGTKDVVVSRNWLNIADHITLASARRHCIEYTRAHYNIKRSTPLSLVGQSYGGILAYEVAKDIHSTYGIKVDKLALLATPSSPMRTSRFVTGLTRQELKVVLRRTTSNELLGMSKSAAEILPKDLHTGSTQKKLVSLIASAKVDIDTLDPNIEITIYSGEFDTISRFDLYSSDKQNRENVKQIIIEGDVHSDFLSDTRFCGNLIDQGWN